MALINLQSAWSSKNLKRTFLPIAAQPQISIFLLQIYTQITSIAYFDAPFEFPLPFLPYQPCLSTNSFATFCRLDWISSQAHMK